MPDPTDHLGSRVRQLRETRGWSQSELAARLPGVKQQSIDQLEQGKVSRPRFLPELAQALQTSTQWLLTGEEEAPALIKAAEMALDYQLLGDVMAAVNAALARHEITLTHEEYGRLTAALYEIMSDEEKRDAGKLQQAAQNILRYDQFLKRT